MVMAVYLLLTAIEIFLFKPLVDFISMNFWGHFIVYTILLLLINPLITKIICDYFEKKKSSSGDNL